MGKTRFALTAMMLALVPAGAAMAAPVAPNPLFTGRDLFDLEIAGDPQISPDGRTIAYVRRTADIMTDRMRPTIWLVDVASGAQRPLVAGTGSYQSPRWSPDGTRLAYVAGLDGAPQLYVHWMATGTSARITGLPDSPGGIAWSPDGRLIAYSMLVPDEAPRLGQAPAKPEGAKWADPLEVTTAVTYRADGAGYLKPGFNHLFVVPADGGSPRQLTFGAVHAGRGAPSWTADGSGLVFSANLSENWERDPYDSDIYRVGLDGSAPVRLTRREGPDNAPAVSPDGRQIAFIGADRTGKFYQRLDLYVMGLDGSNPRNLSASLDRAIEGVEWAKDGRSLFATYADGGQNKIARIGLDGSSRVVATGLTGGELDRPYSGGEFSVARNGALAVTSGSWARPSDIAIAAGSGVRRLTRLNTQLDGKSLGKLEKLAVTSSFDQRPIDTWIMRPPGFDPAKKYPLILEIHGGPQTAYGPNFATDVQLYAAAGYIVIFANPRGSTSYGEQFTNLIDKEYPGRDYDDLMSAVDAAIATGHVDANNLFVTGGSGGGVLTAWIVGKTDRFRAAATQKPVINFLSFALTADFAAGFSPSWRKERPWEDPMSYWKYSPLSLVGNVKTPTLVVVGSQDYRTPVSESEQYFTALQTRGVPTALVKVPGATHSITARPSQSAAKASAILAWFERFRQR